MQDSRPSYNVTRRHFLRTAGYGAVGVAVFGVVTAACSSGTPAAVSTTTSIAAATTTTAAVTTTTTTTATAVTTTGAPITDLVTSKRVNLDFVSAYMIDRGDGLVIIDTGVKGSLPAIEAVLQEFGRPWSDVGYVVATHRHGDHVGSWGAVIDAASDAEIFAGELDVPGISSGRTITPLNDGDMVNGLLAIATPGHTQGHISMFDPDVGLFTGDALNGSGGGVIGPNPQFTPDMDTAFDSVRKLASLDYEAAYFGHGEPVLTGASAAVRNLAASL